MGRGVTRLAGCARISMALTPADKRVRASGVVSPACRAPETAPGLKSLPVLSGNLPA